VARPIFSIVLLCAFSNSAAAGLIGPDSSHVRPLPDGRHILVMLVPNPPADDADDIRTLPDGRQVPLRTTFPASGCYESGTTTPLWTAPYEDYEIWVVSDDCRYLVRCNRAGPDCYDSFPESSTIWGLKFYDRGQEIKSYDFTQLVDFPSLMPDSYASEFRYDWIGDDSENLTIRDGQLYFQTSTHERYRFNVATGAIVDQFRMWRTLTNAGIALFLMAGVGVAVLMFRKRKRAAAVQGTADCLPKTSQQASACHSARFLSYSLRTLLLVTTAVAVLCVTVPRWPHVVLLVSAVLIAFLLTRAASRYRRSSRFARGSALRRTGFALRTAAAGLAWCCCYVLSAAPVLSLADWLRAPDDVRMAIILTIYRPLFWISVYISRDVFSPLEWYFKAWGIN
jgi:hypothetical protein